MGYMIKQVPEDFAVEEVSSIKNEGKGRYSYFLLQKTNLNTLEAVKAIAQNLRISVKRIGWAGNKDKKAVTKQMISLYRVKRKVVEMASLNNIKLNYLGSGNEEIVLGKLAGNKFAIVIRNLNISDCEKIKRNCAMLKENNFLIPNYFDEQRFSVKNPEIGKLILQGKLEDAAEKIFETSAAGKIHKNQMLLYVHSYQSLLFNKTLSQYIKNSGYRKLKYSHGHFLFPLRKIKNAKLPLIGFGTEVTGIVAEILKKEEITTRNFVIRKFPELSSEGGARDAFVKVNNFEIGSFEDDELNKGMKKVKTSFSLPKGSYATIVVKRLCC